MAGLMGGDTQQLSHGKTLQLGWSPASTRTGKPKAIGVGPDQGKVLYGQDAVNALQQRQPAKQPAQADDLNFPDDEFDDPNDDADKEELGRQIQEMMDEDERNGGRKPFGEQETVRDQNAETGDFTSETGAFEADPRGELSDSWDEVEIPDDDDDDDGGLAEDIQAMLSGEWSDGKQPAPMPTFLAPRSGVMFGDKHFKHNEVIPPEALKGLKLKQLAQLKRGDGGFKQAMKEFGGDAGHAAMHGFHSLYRMARKIKRLTTGSTKFSHAVKRAGQKAKVKYLKMEQRYGRPAAVAMVGAYAGSWVLWATNPLLGAKLAPEPAAQLIALAEAIRKAKQFVKPTPLQFSQDADGAYEMLNDLFGPLLKSMGLEPPSQEEFGDLAADLAKGGVVRLSHGMAENVSFYHRLRAEMRGDV